MAKLRSNNKELSEQTALDLATAISALRKDTATVDLVDKLTKGEGQGLFDNFSRSLSDEEIVVALAQALEEMKALEILFENPQRAS